MTNFLKKKSTWCIYKKYLSKLSICRADGVCKLEGIKPSKPIDKIKLGKIALISVRSGAKMSRRKLREIKDKIDKRRENGGMGGGG